MYLYITIKLNYPHLLIILHFEFNVEYISNTMIIVFLCNYFSSVKTNAENVLSTIKYTVKRSCDIFQIDFRY